MNKFYILEEITQEDLNNLTLERNTLKKENKKLNHYKLLYQKVKDRNDEAIEYLKDREEDNECCSVCSVMSDRLLEILKGNNETQ